MPKDTLDKNERCNLTRDETVGILRQLIAIPTVDPPGNELEAASFVHRVLEREGIDSRIYELGNGRANLVSRLPGTGKKPDLVFSAHFDTIPVDEAQWTTPPFGGEIKNGRLYGRGATDMKSGLVSMICAAIHVKRSGIALEGDLILAFSAAENSSGLGARELVRSGELENAGAMLVGEPSSLNVFIAEKGALWLRAVAKGGSGHGAFVEDWRGDYGNAIVRMAGFIERLKKLDFKVARHPQLGHPSINVGKIAGGISAPIIPGSCTLEIDVRMLPEMTPEAVKREIQSVAGENIDIEIVDYKPPVVTPEDDPFVKLCIDSCERFLDRSPDVTGVPYYSDATTFRPEMDIPIAIVGPGEVGYSGVADEYVEIANVMKTNLIFSRIARRYLSSIRQRDGKP